MVAALLGGAVVMGLSVSSPGVAMADQTTLSPHSWDPGLHATTSAYYDSVHAWGQRQTGGAWGTGPVNYMAGATAARTASSSGTLSVAIDGTYCPGGACAYGTGSGYKSFVQFWNDPSNFIAFGLIHDPGVSPSGTTLMIEGAANGKPVGGYWPNGALVGTSHLFTIKWTAGGIALTIDNQKTVGPYPVTETHPSISFLAAGRNTGDTVDATFHNISFSSGSVSATGRASLSRWAPATARGNGSAVTAWRPAAEARTGRSRSPGCRSRSGRTPSWPSGSGARGSPPTAGSRTTPAGTRGPQTPRRSSSPTARRGPCSGCRPGWCPTSWSR